MTPVELLLSKLEARSRAGSGWTDRCPAHEDRRPSLSVSEGDDGRALVKCHAGCTTEAVCAAVGLTIRDLMPERNDPKVKFGAHRNGKRQAAGEGVRHGECGGATPGSEARPRDPNCGRTTDAIG